MRKFLIFLGVMVLFLLIPKASADLDNFYLGLNKSNAGEYAKGIELLEDNCPDVFEDKYHSAQCYFVLCYDYYMLWVNSKIIVEGENNSYYMGSKKDLFLLNKSVDNCLKTVNISWSNLTNKDLIKNEESGFLISGITFLIDDYLILGDYENARAMMLHLNVINSLDIPNNKSEALIESVYNKFYSTLPKKVEIELIGDLDPLFFSKPEIKPQIILSSEIDSGFEILHTEYRNLFGKQFYDIRKENSVFVFDKKLSLISKKRFLYPLDSFESEIFNISPSRIREGSIKISIIGENSKINGIAYFEKDRITLVLTREIGAIIHITLSFFLLIIGLIFLYRRIKFMKKSSFQPKNLLGLWSFDLSLFSLIYFITSNSTNIFNLLTIVCFIFILILSIKFYKKYKRIFNEEV